MKNMFLFLAVIAMVCLTSCQKDELLNSSNSELETASSNMHLKSAVTEQEPNDTPQSACGPVYSGDTFYGTIESYGSNDFIRFYHSGGPVAFYLTGSISYQNLGLVDVNNNYIGQSWTIAPNQYLVYTELSAGTYYIRVSGYGGTYTVQVNPPFTPGETTYFRILKETVNGWQRYANQYACANYNFAGGIIENIVFSDGYKALMHSYYPWYQETQQGSWDILLNSNSLSNGYPQFHLDLALHIENY